MVVSRYNFHLPEYQTNQANEAIYWFAHLYDSFGGFDVDVVGFCTFEAMLA